MKNKKYIIIASAALIVLLSAFIFMMYSRAASKEKNTAKVTSVKLSKSSIVLAVGDVDKLIAIVAPDNAANSGVTWVSSDENIVKVDSTGRITAIKEGSANIIVATIDGNKTASCAVLVDNAAKSKLGSGEGSSNNSNAVASISLDKTSINLNIGESDVLTAVIIPENAGNKSIIWTSSNEGIAKVDSSGRVTAISSGTATITATTVDGNKTVSCTVKVKQETSQNGPVGVASISLNKSSSTLTVGQTDTLTATVQPSNAANKAVIWTSSNEGVARVDSTGRVTAVSAGTAVITVTTADGNKTATCSITVVNKGIENIFKAKLIISKVGSSDNVYADIQYINYGDKPLIIKGIYHSINGYIVTQWGKITSNDYELPSNKMVTLTYAQLDEKKFYADSNSVAKFYISYDGQTYSVTADTKGNCTFEKRN